MRVFALVTFLSLSFVSAFAQQSSTVAVIDVERLHKQDGIRRLAQVWGVILGADPCHHRCGRLEEKIKTLEKEIAELKSGTQSLGDREARLQEAKGELETVNALSKKKFTEYYDLWMKPLYNDIRGMSKTFASDRKFALVVDKAWVGGDSPVLVGLENATDVTAEFITYCNAEFERLKTETRN